jgi:hypothetical protein
MCHLARFHCAPSIYTSADCWYVGHHPQALETHGGSDFLSLINAEPDTLDSQPSPRAYSSRQSHEEGEVRAPSGKKKMPSVFSWLRHRKFCAYQLENHEKPCWGVGSRDSCPSHSLQPLQCSSLLTAITLSRGLAQRASPA